MRWGVVATCVALGLSACASEPTRLVVLVDSDLHVPAELDRVVLEVRAPDGTLQGAEASLGVGQDLPRTLVLVHKGGPLGPVDVRARGLRAGVDVVARSGRVFFVAGTTRTLRLELLRRCVAVSCPAGQTCDASGCRAEDVPESELLPWSGTPAPLPDSDGGVDGSLDADAGCVPTAELCNGRDDDCDGDVDEDFDLFADPANCGACGAVCAAPAHAAARCSSGACTFDCAPGHYDCNGNAADGCEADLGSIASCGGCGNVCDLPFAAEACDAGVCTVGRCASGRADCDTLRANGCEADLDSIATCGSCGVSCPVDPPHAASVCVSGACELVCDPGHADCDGAMANGCEADLSSPSSCGACGVRCGASAACGPTGCVAGCVAPAVDCGGVCADLSTSPSHCGGCGLACPTGANASATCSGAVCGLSCDPGYADCDGDPASGCEADLGSIASCGACGVVCAPSRGVGACSGGGCVIAACDPGYADCDGDPANGCEADLMAPTSCGSCARACAAGATCLMGACVASPDDVVQVALGTDFACARRRGGAVECWGRNNKGQLGDGGTTDRATPVPLAGAPVASDVATGGAHACVVTVAGGVLCWGDNSRGQLGDGTSSRRRTPTTVLLSAGVPLTGATAVAAGVDHSCAVTSAGLFCWGRNNKGQLGDGSTTNRRYATAVAWPASAAAPKLVRCGNAFSCALTASGGVRCWGDNGKAQLGDGSTTRRLSPVAVAGLTSAVWLSCGDGSACVRVAGGEVRCWGDNGKGQLGDGSTARRASPVVVGGVSGAVSVACGKDHACAVLGAGGVMCWGAGGAGQLGDGMNNDSPTAVDVSSVTDATSVGAGTTFSCAVHLAGGVSCWGQGGVGQLGDGASRSSSVPVSVSGLP